jgi:hypothetical protein
VAAWPAVALIGSYELLMMVIRSAQLVAVDKSGKARTEDPLEEQAAELFAEELAVDRVPSIRVIRTQLHVGQSRAQRVRAYLATLAEAGKRRPITKSIYHVLAVTTQVMHSGWQAATTS